MEVALRDIGEFGFGDAAASVVLRTVIEAAAYQSIAAPAHDPQLDRSHLASRHKLADAGPRG